MISLAEDVKAAAIPVKGVNIDSPTLFMAQLRRSAANATVQAVDARFIADLDHLWAVVRQAWVADTRKISRAKFDIEILLRLACDSRVINTLSTVGIKKGSLDVIFIIVGTEDSLQQVADVVSKLGEVSEDLLVLTPEKEAELRRHHNIEEKTVNASPLTQKQFSHVLAEKAVIALLH
jgi:tRNA threonylcarbamoyladenosine modification (KEOPS) complex Cgi121 subunit